MSIQMVAIQGVVENTVGADVGQDVRPAVEKVLARFDKDPAWRTTGPATDWEKWARALTRTPTMRVSEIVRLELAKRFSPEELRPATAALEWMTLPLGDSQTGRERIQLAAILRSGGRLSALREAVTLAEVDWRDLLVAAGLEHADWPEVLRRHGVPIP
jgi:hypothetical protein